MHWNLDEWSSRSRHASFSECSPYPCLLGVVDIKLPTLSSRRVSSEGTSQAQHSLWRCWVFLLPSLQWAPLCSSPFFSTAHSFFSLLDFFYGKRYIIFSILTFLRIQSSRIKHIHIITQTSPSPRFFHHPKLKFWPLNITYPTPSHSNPSKHEYFLSRGHPKQLMCAESCDICVLMLGFFHLA